MNKQINIQHDVHCVWQFNNVPSSLWCFRLLVLFTLLLCFKVFCTKEFFLKFNLVIVLPSNLVMFGFKWRWTWGKLKLKIPNGSCGSWYGAFRRILWGNWARSCGSSRPVSLPPQMSAGRWRLGSLPLDKKPELPPSQQFTGTHSGSALHGNTTKQRANRPPGTSAQTQILICLTGTQKRSLLYSQRVFVSHTRASRHTHTSVHVKKDKYSLWWTADLHKR